jgi:hypothetical protein
MTAGQLIQYIKDNYPDWVGTDHFKWLQWALQSSPDKAAILQSVQRDIDNGVTDISQVNINAEYNAQQSKQAPPSSPKIPTASIYPGEYPGQQSQSSSPSGPTGAQWTSVQQMEAYIKQGGGGTAMFPGWDAAKEKTSGVKFDPSGLANYVQGLPKNQQQAALASIQKFLQDRSGWTPLRQQDLADARAQAVRDVQASQPKSSTSTGSVSPAGQDQSQNLFTVSKDATDPSPDQIAQFEAISGQNFDQAYKNFVNSQYVSVQQQLTTATGSVLTGQEMLWSNGKYEPISTSANSQGWQWAFTAHPKSEPLTPQEQAQAKGKDLQVSKAQFLGMMVSSNTAQASKLNLIQATEEAIKNKYGITLTPDEKKQIYDKIAVMSTQQLAEAVTTEGQGPQGWAANAISPTGIFGNFVNSLPEVSQNVAQANAITALQNGLGSNYAQYVTPDQITALSKMSQADQTNYINNLPDPTHPGFTVGSWNSGYGQILNQWQTEFGFSSKPSDSQISALMGMNTTQRTDYFNNSPSPVSGMNNLTYKNYDTTINNIRGDLTPSMGADFIASLANNPQNPVNAKK